MTFDRANFNRMIAEIEAGNVATVIIKEIWKFRSLSASVR
jgi:site-specific DNA recombinase